jgi:hypothetical protein
VVPVPEVEAVHLATLSASAEGWAMLTADGRSYKCSGDVARILWWAIKTVPFETGELDPYDPTIHKLSHDAPIV